MQDYWGYATKIIEFSSSDVNDVYISREEEHEREK
jgi:hypothetical protein